jgi:GMP synthase-like glutamine amidotransferase
VRRALILQHGDWGPPALLADWAQARGIPFDVYRVDHGGPWPELDGQLFVASLGSNYSPADAHVRDVAQELEFIAAVVAHGIPVLGLCYGAQVLAVVLGGSVEAAPEPELGWHTIDSDAPELVAAGPWLQWHYHRFTLPPGARELARSARALQAFSSGPHFAVQFHPESTIEIVQGWARLDGERLQALGIEDGEALAGDGAHLAAAARADAFALFDAFWQRARPPERRAA